MGVITKKEKVLLPSPPRTQTKVGYVSIYTGTSYGERNISVDDPVLYENKDECLDETKDDGGFLAVATVTWEESA